MRINKLWMFLSGLLLVALLAGCGGGSESWTDFESELWGVALELPASWVAKDADEGVYAANTQQTLDSDTFTDGSAIMINITPMADLAGFGLEDPVALLEFYTEFMVDGDTMSVINPTTQLSIQGNPAAMATFKSTMLGQEGFYTIAIIVGEENMAAAIAIDTTTDNSFSDTLDRIIRSISF